MRKLSLDALDRLSLEEYKQSPKIPIVVVLDNIRSGMNIGSVFRSCDAFRIDHLYLCGISAKPPHREIHKTSIGATHSVDWSYFSESKSCLQYLQEVDYRILGVEQTDESIALEKVIIKKNVKYALVFGNEVDGIEEEILPFLDGAIEIRQFGTKHSLNISVCAGIVLWHFSQGLNP